MAVTELSFPLEVPGGTDGLEKTYSLMQVTPGDEEHNAYSLLVPKSWTMEPDVGEQLVDIGALTTIGRFVERPGPRAALAQVSMTRLPVEVSVRDWLRWEAQRFGVQLVVCRDVQFTYGQGVDAGGWYGPDQNRYVVRLVAFADEARIFVMMVLVPAERYSRLLREATILTQSFHLLTPTRNQRLEQWLSVRVAQPPTFQVDFPASWHSRYLPVHLPGKSGVDLLLLAGEELQSYLRVKALDPAIVRSATDRSLLDTAAAEVEQSGTVLLGPWSPAFDEEGGFPEAPGQYVSDGRRGDQPIELRCTIARRDPLVFVLTLLSVRRSDNPFLWLRGKRAQEIAANTARPLVSGEARRSDVPSAGSAEQLLSCQEHSSLSSNR